MVEEKVSKLNPAAFSIANVSSLVVSWAFVKLANDPQNDYKSERYKSDHEKRKEQDDKRDCAWFLILPVNQLAQFFDKIQHQIHSMQKVGDKLSGILETIDQATFLVNGKLCIFFITILLL